MKFHGITGVLLAAGLMVALPAGAEQQARTLTIGTNNWAENIAVANLWQQLLTEQGYEVELESVAKSVLFSALAEGDLDVSLELWLPFTDRQFIEPYEDRIEVGEIWYDVKALSGLIVPEYVEIDSIGELAGRGETFAFNGQPTIVGIDSGAAIAGQTDEAIERYALDGFRQINSSEPAMMATLDEAYNNREPLVVTLWRPHWAFAEYDLKYLEDPERVYGEGDDVHWMAREGFTESHPEVAAMLDRWQMSDEQLSSLMAGIEALEDPAEGASRWIEDHRALVETWMTAR